MIGRRTLVNLGVFAALSALLVYLGATTLVFQKAGGRTVNFEFADAAGLAARNDVTMRGVPVGQVTDVTLTPKGIALVKVTLQPGTEVTRGTRAEIMRRSPIGDLVLNLTPGNGPALADGATVSTRYTEGPPDPEKTIEELALILGAVPSKDLASLVDTLATAVQGRAQDLQTFEVASADLPERLLQIRGELQSLIDNGPKVLDVLASNSGALADDITQTANLADILRDQRFNLVDLSKNGANFAQVANDLLASEKPNISCLLADMATVNATLAQPQHLRDLEGTLELNHYFFDAVWELVQPGRDGLDWFRVQLLPAQQPPGTPYTPKRPPPDVFPGNSCQSIFGAGVGPVTQPGPAYLAPGSQLHPGH